MDINITLYEETESYLSDYDCSLPEIYNFLTTKASFLGRQREAIRLIEGIMTSHGKQYLLHYVTELARVEHGIRELEPWVRDHVVHAVLSFILGIYINEKFLSPNVNSYIHKLQWKLAGLFHDVGYPIQVARDIMKPFVNKINWIKRTLNGHTPDVYIKVVPVGLDNLANNINGFDLIQARLDEWGLQINAKKEYDDMIESGEIYHGIISSLAILYVIDLMYQKYNPKREYSDIYAMSRNINWNQVYFDRDIVSSCSAIYIHDLPRSCFARAKIDRLKTPLAFLLKLSDCLQEWERPSFDNPTGFFSNRFDIRIDGGNLILDADIPIRNKDIIREEIASTLANPDVYIY